MNKNYTIVDFMNMAHRCKNTAFNNDIDTKIGLAMHTIFSSMRKVNNKFKTDHVVICCEGNSWRKKYYSGYKKNRVLKQAQKPISEQEDDKIFFEAISELETYLAEKTRASVLKSGNAEGDDMIAIFISSHPDDHHTIISSDTDFYQLLAENVDIYNGITDQLITINGIFDAKGNQVLDKNDEPKLINDPEYELFLKCIRGDKSDNIFSAYPGVREKGTKNKVGIIAAFEDRHKKGYDWNNFMLTTWNDADGHECVVQEKYEFNKRLIDLTMQPADIRNECLVDMANELAKDNVTSVEVGLYFLKFCGAWRLERIANYPSEFTEILNTRYVL